MHGAARFCVYSDIRLQVVLQQCGVLAEFFFLIVVRTCIARLFFRCLCMLVVGVMALITTRGRPHQVASKSEKMRNIFFCRDHRRDHCHRHGDGVPSCLCACVTRRSLQQNKRFRFCCYRHNLRFCFTFGWWGGGGGVVVLVVVVLLVVVVVPA